MKNGNKINSDNIYNKTLFLYKWWDSVTNRLYKINKWIIVFLKINKINNYNNGNVIYDIKYSP